jgi:hypothetical protein
LRHTRRATFPATRVSDFDPGFAVIQTFLVKRKRHEGICCG